VRWLRAISAHRVTVTGGPNFAYDLCAKQVNEAEKQTLDLSTWRAAVNGAEPVRAETLERFAAAFAPCGFRREAFYPTYGLAEATLFVTGGAREAPPVLLGVEKRQLEQKRVVPGDAGGDTRTIVGCGSALRGARVEIVEPESGRPCARGEVGEIWVAGKQVGGGYWRQPEETERTFRARLEGREGVDYLRTGDLGFIRGGELFVTGRLKDLIIIRGRNLYPQDIERTAAQCHTALEGRGGAAFSLDADGEERLVIVHEVGRHYRRADSEVFDSIRRAVSDEHEVEVYAVGLLKPGGLPRTSSGKTRRRACRQAFLEGTLPLVGAWTKGSAGRTSAPRAGAAVARRTAEEIREWLVSAVAAKMRVGPERVGVAESLSSYELDSLEVISISAEMEDWLGVRLSPTIIYEHPTIESLAEYIASLTDEKRAVEGSSGNGDRAASGAAGGGSSHGNGAVPRAAKPAAVPPAEAIEREPIAVVGIGCRFPGAKDAESFWRMLRDGVDAVREVPRDRWDVDEFYDPTPATPGKMNTRWGGFLDEVDKFDPQFFGISPREAQSIEPQQRLLLEVCSEALENAGQAAEKLAGSQTGIFVGISTEEYSSLVVNDLSRVDGYTGTGVAISVAAGRLSYAFGFHGPAMSVDTACSSSLVTVHLACQSLRNGECDLALAGGVNLILSPRGAVYFSQVRAMASDGRCKTFDASADGYVRGEGCGMVVLKRLRDALQDGDKVLALIRGSAINHDGRSGGLTVPNSLAQQGVIRQALRAANVEPARISYVEAHGTGTELGDPIEVRALAAVLGEGRSQDEPLSIGSVKTNIGHLESAAGVAGLIKVVLSMQHGELPPHLHFEKLNPHISLDAGGPPLQIPTRLTPWTPNRGRRLAGISSFGISGTNAHVIIEETPPELGARGGGVEGEADTRGVPHLLPLSARSREALSGLVEAYAEFLSAADHRSEVALEDICYTAGVRRSHYEHRLAFVARSREELAERLSVYLRGEVPPGTSAGQKQPGRKRKLVFVFPGQGSQWQGMGRELLRHEPVFRETLECCDEAMRRHVDWSLLELLADESPSALEEIDRVQPALFAMQAGLAAVWASRGIHPDAVVGQSMGEVAAAYVSGALSLDDAARVICRRSRLLKRASGKGAMLMVELSLDEARRALASYEDRVSVAVSNWPRSTVLSGDPVALEEIAAALEEKEVFCRRVKVDVASHSPQMDCLREELLEVLDGVCGRAASVPFHSTVNARVTDGTELDAAYWVRNLREPVLFSTVVHQLADTQHDIFLEVSPHPILLPAIEQGLRSRERE